MRETGDKEKGGEGRKKGEEWEKTTPCPPLHRFRDSFCLFGITNAHHTPVICKLTKYIVIDYSNNNFTTSRS
jgi:hypothetical protein